jgi:hypothetical protein
LQHRSSRESPAGASHETSTLFTAMSPRSDKVIVLRRLLAERFPATRPPAARRVVATGVAPIDARLGGGLATGALTELVSLVPSAGNQLALGSMLAATREACQRVALIDAAGTFDLEGFDDDSLAHLVWVRCGSLAESWRAVDLAARDPNYRVVVLDLRGFSVRELQRTRDAVWVRLQRAAEQADTALAVQTTAAVVPNAGARLLFPEPLADDAFLHPRTDLCTDVVVERQRFRIVHEAVG